MAQSSTALISICFVSLVGIATFTTLTSMNRQSLVDRFKSDAKHVESAVVPEEPSPAEILERQLSESQQPSQLMALHTSLGHVYRDEGHYDSAAKHYEAVRDLTARTADSEQLIQTLVWLSSARHRQGRLMEARGQLEKAHALSAKASDSLRASVVHSLGNVLRDLGLYDKAFVLYKQAEEHGADAGLLASDLADAHARCGELEKALESAQVAVRRLKVAAQTLPGLALQEELDLAMGQSVLGFVQHAKGDFTRAAESYKRALQIQLRLRPGHPDRVSTELRQVQLQRDSGQSIDALATASALVVRLRTAARESRELSAVLALQADLMREAGKLKEAELALREGLLVHQHCCGDEDQPELAVLLHILGSILHDQGKQSAALENYDRSLQMFLRTVGSVHPEVAALENSLGTLHQDMGEPTAAQEHFTKCLELQLQTLGPKNPDVSNTYNNLATVLAHRGERSEAEELLKKALKVLDDAGVPAGNPERSMYTANLAALNPQSMSI